MSAGECGVRGFIRRTSSCVRRLVQLCGDPLYGAPNVILSPHVSGFVASYDDDCCTLFAENLRRYLDGVPLLNLVDRAKGY